MTTDVTAAVILTAAVPATDATAAPAVATDITSTTDGIVAVAQCCPLWLNQVQVPASSPFLLTSSLHLITLVIS